ncbi:hypothetical protein ACFOZ1_12045 [Gracilibacillus marinus]|jgi:hypothetical protein|uniref:Uncharacterized protein n=2 Tax=Gracilibacillus marinus TaxID=630535 RepID=A0ABV8VZU6_9BACI
MMISSLIILAIISIILWIFSYFMKDRYKQLEDQFEQFSISSLQETYQIKKKLKILEEELLVDDEDFVNEPFKNNNQDIRF